MKERRSCQKLSLISGMDPSPSVKCKIVVVGDSQCGKTALLHVFAKDCFPEVRPRNQHDHPVLCVCGDDVSHVIIEDMQCVLTCYYSLIGC